MHERLAAAVRKVPMGDGMERPWGISGRGPLVSAEQREQVLGYIEAGRAEGAEIAVGGGVPTPRLLRRADPLHRRRQLDDDRPRGDLRARWAASSPSRTRPRRSRSPTTTAYWPRRGVWTRDLSRAHRMAAALQTGTVGSTLPTSSTRRSPTAAAATRGSVAILGDEALYAFTELKSVVIAL